MNLELIQLAVAAGGALVAGAVAVVRHWRFRRGQAEAWRQAARQAELEIEGDAATPPPVSGLVARLGKLELRFEPEKRSKEQGTKITVRGFDHGPRPLSITRQGLTTWIGRKLGREDHLLGATADDDQLQIRGDELLAQALLDADTRRRMVHLLSGKLFSRGNRPLPVEASLVAGELEIWVPHKRRSNRYAIAAELAGVLTVLLRLARRLERPEDPVARLASRLKPGKRQEPEAGARLRGLRLLLRDHRDHPATVDLLERLAEDPAPAVRLEVGIARGTASEASLLPWAENAVTEVAAIAAGALGRLGTVAAVPVLRALEARGEPELSEVARQAIAEIQARLESAAAGQLSLAGSEGGALSLAPEGEVGRVSLAEDGPSNQGLGER